MAEPEDVIAEGALFATHLARELWSKRTERANRPELRDLRRRLELLVVAVFPGAPEIGVADPPAPLSLLARLAHRRTSHLHSPRAQASMDGERIRLPASLDHLPPSEAPRRYQLLALEQACRASRGTLTAVPDTDPLLRDLYLLAEAAAVDCTLVRILPGLRSALRDARIEAAAQGPIVPRPSRRESAMVALAKTLLEADPVRPPVPFVVTESPADSRRWAEGLCSAFTELAGPYRGMPPIPLWGAITTTNESLATGGARDGEPQTASGRTRTLPRRPRVRDAGDDEDDVEPGPWMLRADDAQEKAEDPAGLQRPADRDENADAGELADALSELPELRLVRSPDAVREVLAGEDPIRRRPGLDAATPTSGVAYPEWDWRAGNYRSRGAIVWERPGEEVSDAWPEEVLLRHAAIIRRVRRDFERLRPRRTVLRRQADGADLDIDALVAAFADRRGGGVTDDRFYIDARPLRRDAAIALLVDVSASTDGWVSGDRRIVDVEKEALLIVGEALAALGDPHAILSFSGQGPGHVDVRTIKRFDEQGGRPEVRRRIAGLEPSGYTRAGAAIRHASVALMRQPARHRLLLLLSDGRPNDVDLYEGRYGIEDTRVAVAEARLQGIHPFCLTVDREAPRYATRIFGRDFAVLSRAERLPVVLTALLSDLMRG